MVRCHLGKDKKHCARLVPPVGARNAIHVVYVGPVRAWFRRLAYGIRLVSSSRRPGALHARDIGGDITAMELAVFAETRRAACSRFRWSIHGRYSAVVFAGTRSHYVLPVPVANVH